MITYDLYGLKSTDLSEIKHKVEKKLGFSFEERDSSYHGRYYQYGEDETENFILKVNIDLIDGEAAEQKYSSYPILLYVNSTARSEEIKFLLGNEYDLLSHEIFD